MHDSAIDSNGMHQEKETVSVLVPEYVSKALLQLPGKLYVPVRLPPARSEKATPLAVIMLPLPEQLEVPPGGVKTTQSMM